MCKNLTPKELVEYLSIHIKQVEELKDSLIKEYFSDSTEENLYAKDFFKEYSETINNYLELAKAGKRKDENCPFVIIGSIVEVQDTDDMEIYKYRIILPYEKSTDMSIDSASCLSPLGKALILKSIGEQVNIEIPAATLHYVIKNVTIPEQPIGNNDKQPKFNIFMPPPSLGL